MNIDLGNMKFQNADSEGFFYLREVGGNIALCVSDKDGTDTEVLLSSSDCKKLIELLQSGLDRLKIESI